MAAPQVPDPLGRLWRLPAASRLGRPAELGVERVVRAAVSIADAHGLGAVTLSRVAASLGFTTMSLYRHVGSRDELQVLMGDLAFGPPPEHAADDWRPGLVAWAHALRDRYAEHPWLARVPVSGPPSGPHAIGWLDAGLRSLRDTPLDWAAKVGAVSVLSGYVRGAAQLTQELAAGRSGTGRDQAQVERDYGRALAGLVDPECFPDAAALFAADVWEKPTETPTEATDPDPDFTFGLDVILAGIAATITATGNI